MTAPRAREQSDQPSAPDRLPPRRGGGSSSYTYAVSANGSARPAGFARLAAARRGLVQSAWALAAAALLALSGALALPAAAQTDVTVSFGAASYDAYEGDSGTPATVRVQLTPLTPLATALVVPLTAMGQDGATANDWTAPASVTIAAGAVAATFEVAAGDASGGVWDWDPGESVLLGFGTLPTGFAPGTQDTATVVLHNDETVPIEFYLEVPEGLHISEGGDEVALVGRTLGNEAPSSGVYFNITISDIRGDDNENIKPTVPGTGTFQMKVTDFSQDGEIYVGRKTVLFTAGPTAIGGPSIEDDEQAEDTERFTLGWNIKAQRGVVGADKRYREIEPKSFRMYLVEDDFKPVVGATEFDFVVPGPAEVATLEATDGDLEDADGGALAWTIQGGADRGKFNLTSAGVLAFKTRPDPASPSDADSDGVYEVKVRVTDGYNPVDADIEVRVVRGRVENLTAVPVAPMRVTLEWDRALPSPKDIDHTDFPGYRIEWSADGNTPWTSLVNITNQYGTFDIWCTCYPSRFNDNTIAPETTRYYRIKTVDGDDESPWSDVVSATTPGLVDSGDDELREFGVVDSELDALNDQKVFRVRLVSGEAYWFTVWGEASKHRVIVTDTAGTEIENFVHESTRDLAQRITAQSSEAHQVKISHGGSLGNAGSLNAGSFRFVLLPVREDAAATLRLPGTPSLSPILNTYGDLDSWGVAVQPGKAYAVRVWGRETDRGTAATPRIKRARPPSTTHVYNMGKPWVDGVTIAKRSPICRKFAEPEKCEYQAFVIDLRGQTGAEQTWRIDVATTARPRTRPYLVGTYDVDLRELSSSELQGVRMPLRAWFASQPAQHDGSKRIKVRVGFSDAVAESPEHGVKVEGGEVTSVRPVDGNAPGGAAAAPATTRSVGGQDGEVIWEFEIEPDSDGDVTVSLEAWRPCDETGVICTADGRVLSQGISTTVRGPGEAPPPLTASLESMPEAHDGESAFRFRVAFSEDIGISYRSLREDAFAVSGGQVTRGKRVDDRRDLFEMTVEPDGDGDVTVTLPAGRECSVSGAICTKGENRRQLTNTPTATVAGPAVETGPAGLTARFARVPSEHDGKTAFKLRIAFSETIRMSGRRLRSEVVAVAGGRATKAGRVNRRKDLWKLTVRPDSLADVTVTLSSGAACDSPGAVCTADGRALSNTVSATVRGPVAVSVADARAREGEDETIDFAVSLSRAASGAVSVTYATADGTATAGSDYTRASGMLRFAPGETEKTISVPVLDDAHDEGSETLTVTLSNATGAWIEDPTATGTINNSDHMPQAWMVRLGRTVGSQVVDALTARLEGGASSHVTVGGINLTGAPGVEPEGEAEDPFGLPEWAKQTRREEDAQTLNADDLLLRSAFHLSSGGGTQGPAFTAWGRVATGGFEATVDDVTMDGDVTTGLIGFDAEWERLLAGVMLSQSEGDGAYRLDPAKGDDAGTVESTLTGVYPYARVDLNARVSAWALAGMGSGEITLHQEGAKPMPTDIRLRMGALGVKGEVLDGTGPGGLALNVKSDAMWVGTKSADTSELAPTEGDVTRVRFIVEGERAFEVGEGATFTPSAEVGLRHDGGDAETGTGLEVGGGVRYTAGQLTIEGQVRTLMAHEDGGYKEWGATGAIRITPSPSGHGLMLAIAPEWGRTASATERLWSARDASALGADGEFEADSRLAIDAGYGIGLRHGRGVLTPYAGLTLGDADARTVRTGTRWQLGTDAVLGLETTRQTSDAGETDNRLMLRVALRF